MLGQPADQPLGFGGLKDDVMAADQDIPLGSGQVAGEDVHQGGFPGPVRPQEAHQLSFLDLSGELIQRAELPIALADGIQLDHHDSFRKKGLSPIKKPNITGQERECEINDKSRKKQAINSHKSVKKLRIYS